MKRAAGILGVAVALCCATASASQATTATTTAAGGSSLIHVTVPSAGITLGYPAAWTATKYSGLPKAARNKIAKLNPKLASQVQSAPSNAKLYAVDLAHPGTFTDNINVIVMTSGGFPASLADFRRFAESQYRALGATDETASAVKIGGKTAYSAVVHLPLKVNATTTVNAYLTQLLIPKGDGATIVSIGTTDDDPGHALAQQIASTIKLLH